MNDWKDLAGGFIHNPKSSLEEAVALKGHVYFFSPMPAKVSYCCARLNLHKSLKLFYILLRLRLENFSGCNYQLMDGWKKTKPRYIPESSSAVKGSNLTSASSFYLLKLFIQWEWHVIQCVWSYYSFPICLALVSLLTNVTQCSILPFPYWSFIRVLE